MGLTELMEVLVQMVQWEQRDSQAIVTTIQRIEWGVLVPVLLGLEFDKAALAEMEVWGLIGIQTTIKMV